jgi:hypothetical protein
VTSASKPCSEVTNPSPRNGRRSLLRHGTAQKAPTPTLTLTLILTRDYTQGDDLGAHAREEMSSIQKSIQGMYTEKHPGLVQAKVEKSEGILVVWHTSK